MFRLRDRLRKTREQLTAPFRGLFQNSDHLSPDDEERIEEALLGADIGVSVCERVLDDLRKEGGDPRPRLRKQFLDLLGDVEAARSPRMKPRALVIVGINGVGKTTSVGKLAKYLSAAGETVLIAACDTFRAAATDQLAVWAQRSGVDMIRHQDGGDPGAVAFDACAAATARGIDTVLVDTAGRLHTKTNLMEELAKIVRVCAKSLGEGAVETLLVLDSTLGQNSLVQAAEFTRRVAVDGVILTKLDSTARGGIAIAVGEQLGIAVRYIGVGEKIDDFAEFSAEEFVDALLDPDGSPP